MVNVIISGPRGRMGQALCRLASENNAITLLGTLVETLNEQEVPGLARYERLTDLPEIKHPLVIIDFTQPEGTLQRVHEAVTRKVAIVIGTTGFTEEQLQEIRKAAETIPVLLSANMSMGINVLSEIIQQVASRLTDYDIEIIETHHRLKKDAPSGTALILAEAAAAGRSAKLTEIGVHGRSGLTGERPAGEIGIHAIRGGDVVGDHTVLFAGIGERLEFTHKASSRDTFAAGALFAAQFIATQPPGMYSMKDALKSPLQYEQ